MDIKLKFDNFTIDAKLFDNDIARKLFAQLPITVNDITSWGNELYGSIGIDLGEENPVSEIPVGGIAYTNQGNYICLFYGQRPAWEVEHIGAMLNDEWEKLKNISFGNSNKIMIIKNNYE